MFHSFSFNLFANSQVSSYLLTNLDRLLLRFNWNLLLIKLFHLMQWYSFFFRVLVSYPNQSQRLLSLFLIYLHKSELNKDIFIKHKLKPMNIYLRQEHQTHYPYNSALNALPLSNSQLRDLILFCSALCVGYAN